MKTTDLMIGDFLRNKRTGEVFEVFEIDGDRDVINNEADGYNSERNVGISDAEPIPLTAEILAKNFRPSSKSYDSFDPDYIIPGIPDSFGLELRNKVLYITDHVLMPLRYVHELQHALRLCGLHELADNFKI